MEYEGKNKKLTVICQGKSWTHTSEDFPTEAYFVFTLSKDRKVCLLN